VSSATPARAEQGTGADRGTRVGRPATILVVDDDALTRETLSELLQKAGYRVIAIGNGNDAFDRLGDVDLVILDCMLPGRSGWEICHEIKEQHDPLLPVLMVTARTSSEDVVRAFRAGADDYIAKPFAGAELAARIGTRLRVHSAERELHQANVRLNQLYQQARADAEERARLLRELDHRVRNILSVIIGLVTLEQNRRPPRPPGEALGVLENRLRAFMLAHEVFRGENYRGVPVAAVVDGVTRRLSTSFDAEGRIALEAHWEPVLLSEREAVAVALILNELVTNSFRHAFAGRAGRIQVYVTRRDAGFELDVSDDGVGLTDETAAHPVGSGDSIVQALARELGASVEQPPASTGTHVIVRFPPQRADERDAPDLPLGALQYTDR
jgi:DNA-binding response OmpR family regulator